MAWLGDAMHRAAQKPDHSVLSRAIDAAEPQDRHRHLPPCSQRLPGELRIDAGVTAAGDRKSTRLNSSHVRISYAVFCLKKKKQITKGNRNIKQKKTQNIRSPTTQHT